MATIDKKLYAKLRKPQKEAFDKMLLYSKDYKAGKTHKAALVQMPTGSGKTGVIACLAHYNPYVNNVLIISPRIALRNQLMREVGGVFFKGRGFKNRLTKVIYTADADKDFPVISGSDNIVISTIQKLHNLAVKENENFLDLIDKIDLILFDEGHYEPSALWSSTIRSFNCPRIIFTATPFRNDFKSFDIDSNYTYSYSLNESIATGILRRVEVIKRTKINRPSDFVKDVLTCYDELCTSGKVSADARIIIRCDDEASIRQIAKVLSRTSQSFVAVHENFDNQNHNTWEHKNVPDPQITDAKIWIHQYKLLEGIDEPRFRVLALFEPFKNTRQLIQQVGRIIRNPEKVIDQAAYFIDHSNGKQEKMWNDYLEYDKQSKKFSSKSINDMVIEGMADILPSKEYIDKDFRERFDINQDINPIVSEIKLPLRCNLIEQTDYFDVDTVCNFLEKRFKDLDFRFKKYSLTGRKGHLYFYIQITNSPILAEKYFLNLSLNVCVFTLLSNKRIAFFDTLNFSPINFDKIGFGKAVSPKLIKKMLAQNEDSRLTQVTLKNSNLGNRSVRTHSYSASSIEEVTPYLDDHAQIISGITGYSFEGIEANNNKKIMQRRYIGISKGRISEGSDYHPLEKYLSWLDGLDSILSNSKRKALNTFERYSREKYDVKETDPLHILLDLSEVEELRFKDVNEMEREVIFEDLSSEISEISSGNFEFTLMEDANTLYLQIRYDQKRKKYLLESADIKGKYFTDGEEKKGLITLLNETQSFRIVPKEKNCIYIDGNFYEPVLKVGQNFDEKNFHVGKILITDPFLEKNGHEKGKVCKSDHSGWEVDSLFDLIHRRGKATSFERIFGSPDILICDDMGTEVADFILSDNNRIVFIHAKGLGNDISYCSASKLQDVCGQATKNIQYLSMFNGLQPKHLNRWDLPWRGTKTKGYVKSRKLMGTGKPEQLWDKIQTRIKDPLSNKEVWLVLGRMLSKKALLEGLKKDNPSPEAVQAAILLHGTMTNVNSIGAKLRIFCQP